MKYFLLFFSLVSISFSLQAKASPDWTCDSGFKSSLGSAYISKLQLNSKGKYDLSIGSSPSDGGGGKTIEPLSIISNLDCKFSKNNNGAIVNCSNESDVGDWFSMSSSFNTTTSIDSAVFLLDLMFKLSCPLVMKKSTYC